LKKNFKVNKYDSSESVNNWWAKQGYSQPPYAPKTVVQNLELLRDTKFVRVYDGDNSEAVFMNLKTLDNYRYKSKSYEVFGRKKA